MCNLVVANRTTASPGRRIKRGTVLCADDPVVKRTSGVFEPYRVHHYCGGQKSGSMVEQATAAPGERRTVRPPTDTPQRPPTSGPGSGVDAWRRYANQRPDLDLSEAELAELSRDELIDLVS